MNQSLSQLAIENALLGKWKEAINLNFEILKNNPHDVDALNRIARAYFESGNIKLAKASINKVLKIDPYNPIAKKCCEKWKSLVKIDEKQTKQISTEMFLEEPGKTKLVHLIHTCDKPVLAKLNSGDMVYENIKSHRISILTDSGKYIGKLPDDVSIKLKAMIKLGYKYVITIKSVDKNEIKIFIREVSRPDNHLGKSSFSSETVDYTPYTPPEMLHDRADIVSYNDESDLDRGNPNSGNSINELTQI
jgi:tetratricopeptide (TPR) repeat protein